MAQLAKGLKTKGIVLEIEENFDFFEDTKSDVGGTRHCHKALIKVENLDYDCQYCSSSEHLTEFQVGDTVEFEVKSFSRNIHTIGVISCVKFQSEAVKNYLRPTFGTQHSGHINMAGTPEAIALQCATQFHTYRQQSSEIEVTEMADIFCKWLRATYQHNINPQL